MTTEIFDSFEDFKKRSDKTVNGVSIDFLNDEIDFNLNTDTGNTCCWNCAGCWDCKECIDCIASNNCTDCISCINCNNCDGCTGCTDCMNCDDCLNCVACKNCLDCKKSTNCEHSTNLNNNEGIIGIKVTELTTTKGNLKDVVRNIVKARR